MIFWKACTNKEYASLINSKPFWNCMTLEFIRRYRSPIIQRWKMVKRSIDQKLRLRNFDARIEGIENRDIGHESQVPAWCWKRTCECYQWKATGQCSRGDRCSFWHDQNKRAKLTPKWAPPSEPPKEKDGRSISRRKSLRGRSPSGKFARQPCRDYIKCKCTRPSCDCWHPPGSFAQRQVEDQLSKSRKRMVTEVQWQYWKIHDSWVAYFRTLSRRNLHQCYGGAQKSWDQFDECNSQMLRCVTQTSETAKVRRSEWLKWKILISAVRSLQNLRIGLRKRLRDKSDLPAETRGDWPEVSYSSKKRTKLLFHTCQGLVSPSTIRKNTAGKKICCRYRSINAPVEQEKSWTLPNWKP